MFRSLDLGAADYVVKPFLRMELAARIRAALRRRRKSFARATSASCQVASCVNSPRMESPVGADRASWVVEGVVGFGLGQRSVL